MTQDYGFAVREMLRDQLTEPVPGLWLQLPLELAEHPGLQETVFDALASQRTTVQHSRGRRYTTLAQLQRQSLEDLSRGHGEAGGHFREVTIGEARCKDLVLMARLLVEQNAMLEAAHDLGMDHPADRAACRTLFRASLEALEDFDRRLESGMALAEALAIEILLESVAGGVSR
jgi:hypothetical protein